MVALLSDESRRSVKIAAYLLLVSGAGFIVISILGGPLLPWYNSSWYLHTLLEFSLPATILGGLTISYLGYYVLEKDQYHRPIGLTCIALALTLTVGMVAFSTLYAPIYLEGRDVIGRADWFTYSSTSEFAKIVVFYTIRTGMVLPLITTAAAGTALTITDWADASVEASR